MRLYIQAIKKEEKNKKKKKTAHDQKHHKKGTIYIYIQMKI